MPENRDPELSRRGLLLAGLAGVSAPVVPVLAGQSSAAQRDAAAAGRSSLPTVKPLWSQNVYEAFGVCAHPNFGRSTYRYTSQWMDALAQTGASYFRGMYAHRLAATTTTARLARRHGIRWGMTVSPDLSMSDREIVARVRHIATNAADVCLYVEGINEPNHIRGSGAIPDDWARRTVAKQRVIWQAVKSHPSLAHVKVLGPSLQAVVGTESHHRAVRDAGLLRYMDYAALHRYSGGRYPNHLIDERLAWIREYWPGKPTWITETGYTNALASPSGHRPVPEDVSAVYAPSALLEAVDRGCNVAWYQLLDSPDPGPKNIQENNFGMFATRTGMAPPWRPKPVVAVMRSFLSRLEDPGPAYDPPRIGLEVTSRADDVQSTVVAKRNGTVTLHLRRATNCWDPIDQRRIPVQAVPVVVRTAKGTRTFRVDHEVRSVAL